MFSASATSWPRNKSFSCFSIVHRLHCSYREVTSILPIHLPIQAGGADDPLHYVRLTWRRFPGSLRLWRPFWKWADGGLATPLTLISLARSEPISVETYEPMGIDLVLPFSKIANADDALAFADRYGFLGTVKDTTAAVSLGLRAINQPALKVLKIGIVDQTYGGPVEIFTGQRKSSDRLLILKQTYFSIGDSKPTMIRIHSSFRDLQKNVSIGDAKAIFREVRRGRQEYPTTLQIPR